MCLFIFHFRVEGGAYMMRISQTSSLDGATRSEIRRSGEDENIA